MVEFLRDILERTRIDQLLMDNEGAEWELIPQLARGGPFDKAGIVICQINTEVCALFAKFD